MADEIFISETQAMRVLRQQGDFTESQARIVLGHSRKQTIMGETYYPATYIGKRAAENAARED